LSGPKKGGAVVAISSHVARGRVGNRASAFALEVLGHETWAIPTTILSYHPGHGRSTRIDTPAQQFGQMLDDLLQSPWTDEVCAVLTGYFAGPAQVEHAARFVAALARRQEIEFLCDPVIGDAGGLYVAADMAAAIRDLLLPLATIATPNRHELFWLAGMATDTLADCVAALRRLGPRMAIATSAPVGEAGRTGNLLVAAGERQAVLCSHDAISGPPNGAGDLASALLLAARLQGLSGEAALERMSAGVLGCLRDAAASGSRELLLARDWRLFAEPATGDIRISRISAP
jgi:pyridoxine kinase